MERIPRKLYDKLSYLAEMNVNPTKNSTNRRKT